jgi:glycosyltransferase involved in cell wall biosynthesis
VKRARASKGEGSVGILYVYSRKTSFIGIDRDLLAERWPLREWYQPGRVPNLPGLIRELPRCDLVFAWFASWHSVWPITLAWLLRKPSILIVGGFDTASMPDIGYGHQQGGLRKWISRWMMRRATRLVTNSYYSRDEIERNTGISRERVTVIHHGVPDPFGRLPDGRRERMALTVGGLLRSTFEHKGHRPFVDAARLLPDVRFVLAGRWLEDEAIDALRARAPDNVVFTGWLPQEELDGYYRRASVYVQASRHEGFGLAVAEAMLAGCVPVVTDATAMPEVVGDAAVKIPSPSEEEVAAGVERALAMDDDARRRARDRILGEFPVEHRRRRLHDLVEELL